jgi:signal transduction histidine kinase
MPPKQQPIRFRTRLFVVLSLFAVIPALLITLLLGATLGGTLPLVTQREGWDSVASTGRRAMRVAENAPLTRAQRAAFDAHEHALRESLEQAQRLNYLVGRGARVIAISSGIVLIAITFGASRVAGHLSRQMSRPIDELVEWTELIRKGAELPDRPGRRGAPEFETLRQRMRMAAVALDMGRQRAIEAERLRAFRESARQVAHELKNPLTPIRFAIARLRRDAPAELTETIDVLSTETERLERTARSFAQFGRLPEGPPAEVDVGELVRYAANATVPETMTLHVDIDADLPLITGHHDALAGALSNVLLNAVDACTARGGDGTIAVHAERATMAHGERAAVRVRVSDDGPGIAPDVLKRIWEPYVTHKAGGTGLGLAIARQAVWAHDGTVSAESTVGAGTRIEFTIPVDAGAEGGKDV